MTGGRRLLSAARWLLRLYPVRFRRRHGDEIEADLERALAGAATSHTRWGLVLDVLMTLPRAWFAEVVEAVVRGASFTWDGVVRDGALAVRAARRSPGPMLVAVATLALALGGNAAVFAVTHAVLLRSLPYDAPDRIVTVTPDPVVARVVEGEVRFGFTAVVEGARSVAATSLVIPDAAASLEVGDGAEHVAIAHVSATFFDVLGVRPLVGGGFASDPSAADQAVISYGLWRDAFGADRSVVGRTIRLSGRSYRVAGVLPPEAGYPSGTDLWLPFPPVLEFYGAAAAPTGLIRLREGVTLEMATAELRDRARTDAAERNDTLSVAELPMVTPLHAALTRAVHDPLLLLWGVTALVLLLGCTIVVGMSLSRLTARSRELSLRAALGAGRAGIFRLVFVDAAVPAAFGGLAAAFVAYGLLPVLVSLLPSGLYGLDDVRFDGPALLFLAVLTAAAATLVGVLVALEGVARSRPRPVRDARVGDPRTTRLQAGLSVVQIALSVVLGVTAGLLGRNLAELRRIPIGFDTEHVLTFQVRLPESSHRDPATWTAFADAVRARLVTRGDVEAIGVVSRLPLADGLGRGVRVWSATSAENDAINVALQAATPDYFDAIGIRLIAGQTFENGAAAVGTVLLGENAADQLFGSAARAVGARLRIRQNRDEPLLVTVAGVVGEVRLGALLGTQSSQLYQPWSLAPAPWPGFAVRGAPGADPVRVAAAVRDAVREVDPAIAPFAIRTTRDVARRQLATDRALALLSSVIGAFAMILAGLGVYGVLSKVVSLRRREIGIRLALGARGSHVAGSVLRHALALAAAGSLIGIALALASGRWLETLLYGVSTRDPATFLTVAGLAVVMATVAAGLPAFRAARTDPAESLRAE